MTKVDTQKSQTHTKISPPSALSLKLRLIFSGLFLVLVLVPIIGITVSSAFEQQIRETQEEQLRAYIYSVLSVLEVDNNNIMMPEVMLENQFNVIDSGLYAVISDGQQIQWQTLSAMAIDFSEANFPLLGQQTIAQISPSAGEFSFNLVKLSDIVHVMYSFGVVLETNNQSSKWIVSIIKDELAHQAQVEDFNQTLWLWLFLLIIALTFIQIIWLYWTLQPLNLFKRELQEVEQGRREKLSENYPSELNIVANGLNDVLRYQQNQQTRYQNSLSDLAHSLKTPLAVLQSNKHIDTESSEQLDNINKIIAYQLSKAKTKASSAWYMAIELEELAKKLINALSKIYQHKDIQILYTSNQNVFCKAQQGDLNELLGNLLDNACKAAKSTVSLSIYETPEDVCLLVEDDGLGLSQTQINKIFERGVRADTYEKGHGIGLSIVRDILDSYQGRLEVSSSISLGGAKFSVFIPK